MTKCLWFPYPKECQSGCKGNKTKKTSLEKSRSKIWEGHHFRVAMFTDVYFLHSRFSISCPNVMISRKPPIPLSSLLFFGWCLVPSTFGRTSCAARTGCKGMSHCGAPGAYHKRREPTVVERGQQKQAQPRVGGNKLETKTMLPKTITNFDSEILALEVFRFLCELEAF